MTKKIKGKKVAAYRVAANAFEQLNRCPDLLTAALNKHGKDMSEEAFVNLANAIHELQLVVYQVYKTTIKPANAEIEASSTNNTDNAGLPRAELLTRSQLCEAADAYAASGGTTIKGWKEGKRGEGGGMLKHLRDLYPDHHKIKRWDQLTEESPSRPSRLENAGITEAEIRDRITNWKPNKSR